MNRIIVLLVLSVVAPIGAVVMFLIYLIVDAKHAYDRRKPIAPISRSQQKRFAAETAAIEARLVAR